MVSQNGEDHKHDNKKAGETQEVEIGPEMVKYQTRFCSVCGKQQDNKIISRRKKPKE